ncbi:hypothetical protein G6F43_006874 [Rhizopus delemar]|nr:hypothetical protein G6F43_006874 [Rhizopus delemar]
MWTRRINRPMIRPLLTRAYQTSSSSRSRLSLPAITLSSIAAASAGYWLASMQQHQPQKIKTATHATLKNAFQELQTVLSAEHVTVDQAVLHDHGHSNNSYHEAGLPNIVVFPSNTSQVVEIVKIADKYDLPIIPFSGGTSLEGHFAASRGGICISFTEHMNEIIAFHQEDMDIVVQPGVQWEDLNEFIKEHGLFFPMDPGPGACIGGMVGTSCSGTNAVRYGTMKEWVINLTVVTPEGKVIKTRQRPRKSSAGYDLTRLFIGSEGTLGIVTEITLKLAVIPKAQTVAVCDFPTIEDAAKVVPELMQAGVQIGAVELLDGLMMKAINLSNPELGYVEKPTLFFKFSGGSQAVIDHEIQVVSGIVKRHQGGEFKYAKSEKEKESLWEGRKIALWSSTLLKPNASVWTTDVVVPVSELPRLIRQTQEDIETSSLPCPLVGHVGDGNFHVFILFDKNNPEEYKEAVRLNQNLVQRAIQMDGSVTGEHGVGIGKKKYLKQELGENTIEFMKKIKTAVDPKGLMNPDKVLP